MEEQITSTIKEKRASNKVDDLIEAIYYINRVETQLNQLYAEILNISDEETKTEDTQFRSLSNVIDYAPMRIVNDVDSCLAKIECIRETLFHHTSKKANPQ